MSTVTDTAAQLAEAEARIERYAVPTNHAEAAILDQALADRRRFREAEGLTPVPVAHTIGYDLYVFPAAEDGDPHTWIVDAADGRPIAAGDETSLASAFAEAVKAYSDRVPACYAIRTFTLHGHLPFGPSREGVTLDDAYRETVAYTETHRGVVAHIIDPQGRLLVTVQDGVPATP